MIDLIKEDVFSFWVPMQISKGTSTGKGGKKRRWIQGIASTKDVDLQLETVEQYGIDFSYFLKYGYFNNDHKPGFENKVGQPTECRVTKEGLWTKGYLFENHKIADSIWELALSLEASQSNRKLGFSIQGKVSRRAGRKIIKCWIQDIAITAAPINTNTWLDVVKSLNDVPQEMWVCDDLGCYIDPGMISPVHQPCGSCQKGLSKFMGGGLALDDKDMDLKKDGDKEDQKALSASGETGRVLVPESLEGSSSDQEYGGSCKCGENGSCQCKKKKKQKKDSTAKSLTFDQCVHLLQDHKNLSNRDATVVAETVFEMNEISI
jgi:hypothetical protein